MAENDPPLGDPDVRTVARREQSRSDVGFAEDHYRENEFEDDGLDLASLWRILWSRRFWILGAGAIGFALALVFSLLQTPLYRSTSVLELNPPTIPILSGNNNGGDFAVPQMDWQFLETQYGILKSYHLARRVVQDLDLATKVEPFSEDATPEEHSKSLTAMVAASIDVKPVRDSRLVALTYTSKSPADAAKIVNGYADAFLETSLDRRYEATAKAREFLEKRLKTTRAELNASERKLVAYAKANNIIVTGDPGERRRGGGSLAGMSLESLNASLAQAQQKRIAAEQRYRQAGSITETNQGTARLRQERAVLQAEYEEKSSYLKDTYPEMVRLRSKIDALTKAISNEAGTASGSLRAEYQAARAEENALAARVRQLSANVLGERERSIQYNILQRELDTNRSLYDALLGRYNEIGVAGGIGTAQAAIVDRGEVPGAPSSPRVLLNLILGLFLGLGLGAAAAFAYDLITDTIKTPEDVREKLRLALLGVIPKARRNEIMSEQIVDRRSPISESYSSLLGTLQFATREGMPASILVASTSAGEGKSTSSFTLASYTAGLGKRVLLLDADMRKPSFIVEESVDVGLSRLLVSNEQIEDHVIRTGSENLWLMPSGPIPANPAELLNSPRWRHIMAELTERFDVVVVDGPPIHGFADAPLLGSVCGGVVLVVQSGKARRQMVLDAIAKLRASNNLIIGAALTRYHATISEYGYSYKYFDDYGSIEHSEASMDLTALIYRDSDGGAADGDQREP